MIITDLTQNYIVNILEKDSLDLYKKSMPDLLGHYFKYWALESYFYKALKNKDEVKEKVGLIESRLSFIESKLNDFGFDTSDLEIILFVGQNCTNGHAFKKAGKFVVWLPVEAYTSQDEVDIFVTHEIIHALHYSTNIDFYFETKEEKKNLGREIMTEGIATYLTSKILGVRDEEALWSNILTKEELEKWMSDCSQNKKGLYKFVLENFYSSDEDIEIFWANDSSDIYKYRSGYFVGLELVKEFVKSGFVKDKDLLSFNRKKLEEEIINIIKGSII